MQKNEIALSNDLNVITAEINSYKQVAGQAIFEIGKRLKHVKENDLVHGEFGDWLNSIEMDWNTANRFIKVSSELNSDTYHNLGSNALYLIATIPEQEREQQHEIPSTGETKDVDEMTVRELREVKAKLKQAEQQTEQAKKSEQIMQKQLEESESKKPETIEVIKEVESEDLQRQLRFSQKENERLSEKQEHHKLKDTTNFNEEEAKLEMKKLQSEADRTTIEIRIAFKKLNDRVSVSRYLSDAISCGNDYEKKKMSEEIKITENILHDIKTAILGRKEIN